MSGFSEFTFAFPEALWAIAVLPFLLALFFAAEKHRQAALDAFLSGRLQPRLTAGVSRAKRRLALACFLFALVLALLALAQPRWGFTWEERTNRGRDVIIAIDTSRSMLAQDLKPNRMARAQFAAQDLLGTLQGDRVGLVAFAGTAFLQAPLTADYDAVRNALNEIDSELIPRGGTNLKAAIETAEDAFGKGESEHRALIIFTDGEELEEDAVEAAKIAANKFRIFTVGLGSAEGGLIPVPNERGGTDFVRDDQGQYVTSRLDEGRLREIAEASGGFYVHLQGGPAEMQQIVREGLGKMKESDSDSRFTKQPIERYQWPLAGAIAFAVTGLLIGDRRRALRKAGPAAAAALFFLSPAVHAAPESDFNQGCEAFKKGDYTAAAQSFSVALGTGDSALQSKAAYNLANTLARRGALGEKKEDKIAEWKNALQHYDRVLAAEPTHADARYNRDLVQKAIDDLEKEQKKQEEEKQDEKSKDEQKKGDQNQDQQGGAKDDQEKEKQDKDQPGNSGDQDKQQQEQKSGQGKNDNKDEQQGQQKQGAGKEKQGEKSDEKKEDPAGAQGKENEQKQGEKKDGESKDGQPKDEQAKDGEKPDPSQNQPPKQGELKAANPQTGDQQGQPQGASDAAQEAAAAAQGKMTDKQANVLLESIKDARPRLLDPRDVEYRRPPRGFKNW